jgi:hypothetical protein
LLQLLQTHRHVHLVSSTCCAHAVLCCAVPRYETNLLNTAGQAMDFLSEVNHDNTYVHLVSFPCSQAKVLFCCKLWQCMCASFEASVLRGWRG